MNRAWWVSVVALLAGCPRMEPPAPAPGAAAPVQVPPGCMADFSGWWAHRDDATFRYRAHDDGGALELALYRVWPDLDGGAQASGPDAGLPRPSALIHLLRTPTGLIGEAVAAATHPSGRSCEVRYPTRVVDCADGGLTLESAAAIAVGEACEAPPRARNPVMLRHQLTRADAGDGVLR